MDFVSNLSQSWKFKDSIRVVIDRLTKSDHFLPLRTIYPSNVAEIFIIEIVKLYGISVTIVYGYDMRFISKFWERLQRKMGTLLHFIKHFSYK